MANLSESFQKSLALYDEGEYRKALGGFLLCKTYKYNQPPTSTNIFLCHMQLGELAHKKNDLKIATVEYTKALMEFRSIKSKYNIKEQYLRSYAYVEYQLAKINNPRAFIDLFFFVNERYVISSEPHYIEFINSILSNIADRLSNDLYLEMFHEKIKKQIRSGQYKTIYLDLAEANIVAEKSILLKDKKLFEEAQTRYNQYFIDKGEHDGPEHHKYHGLLLARFGSACNKGKMVDKGIRFLLGAAKKFPKINDKVIKTFRKARNYAYKYKLSYGAILILGFGGLIYYGLNDLHSFVKGLILYLMLILLWKIGRHGGRIYERIEPLRTKTSKSDKKRRAYKKIYYRLLLRIIPSTLVMLACATFMGLVAYSADYRIEYIALYSVIGIIPFGLGFDNTCLYPKFLYSEDK